MSSVLEYLHSARVALLWRKLKLVADAVNRRLQLQIETLFSVKRILVDFGAYAAKLDGSKSLEKALRSHPEVFCSEFASSVLIH